MKNQVNVSKRTNIKCEHCAHYNLTNKFDGRGSEGLCTFNNKNKKVKYYQRCKHFDWSASYLMHNLPKRVNPNKTKHDTEQIKYLCKRCGRPLTDQASIARGFGKSCYEQRLSAIQKRLKRLF